MLRGNRHSFRLMEIRLKKSEKEAGTNLVLLSVSVKKFDWMIHENVFP